MTKGQEAFLDQMTRKLLVDWCDAALTGGGDTFSAENHLRSPYLKYAVEKKWLSVATSPVAGRPFTTYRVLAQGWDTAARFLKR